MTTQIDPVIYTAAHATAVLTDRSDLGMLKISGETRLDLLNRMSTQKLVDMASGSGAATVLTTDIGRIIDRLIVYVSSDTLYVLTSDNNADAVARYLMRYVFFQDDFQMQDISAQTAVFGIYGPLAADRVSAAGFPDVDMPLHHWREAEIAGATAFLHRTDPIHGGGFFVMCTAEDRDAVWEQLISTGLMVAEPAAFDFLRIEAGLPRFGRELTGDYIPLEANLWDDVSFNKGCYIGQEIIARMESRGKLAKKLVALRPATPVPAGSELISDGKKAGSITSVAEGPDGPVALGYVKTSLLDGALAVGDTAVAVVD